MFGLARNLKARRDFYKSKMPVHGATLEEVVHNYANPAYACRELSQGYNGEGRDRIAAWYGFPEVNTAGATRGRSRFPVPSDFHGVGGLRCVGAAGTLNGETRNREAEGYYCDHFYDRTVYPLVFRLPRSRGFLRGYYMHDSGEVVILAGLYDDELSAFRAAHRYASDLADSEREEDAKFQAESQIESAKAENTETRKAVRALIAEIRRHCDSLKDAPAIADALQSQIRDGLRDLEKNRQRIAALQENPQLAVES